MLGAYYQLTKPGIVYGNALTALAALLFASRWGASLTLMFAATLGLALTVASACVFNNWHDRAMDQKMARTKERPLAAGTLSVRAALVFGAALGLAGFLLLYICANALAALAALAGWVVYVCFYTPLKPRSPWALYVGALAGSAPLLVGYAAGTGELDSAAWLLFAFLFFWQLWHFYAISVYRYSEYRAAGVPLFVKAEPAPARAALARKLFFLSLIVLLLFCAALALWPALSYL